MQLLNLTVENFGLFRGKHTFDLEPTRDPARGVRPLVVISGHNGSGKSTLFQAIALALHGRRTLGQAVSDQTYSDYILGRLHRYEEPAGPQVSDHGGVALTLGYVQSGHPLQIDIRRQWDRSGRKVREGLVVLCNHHPPEVAPSEYQAWLNEILPASLISLLLFDAEQLDSLASPEQHSVILREIVERLLGLDVVERLVSDLDYQLVRRGSNRRLKRLRQEALDQEAILERLESEVIAYEEEASALAMEREGCDQGLASEEDRLVAEGGLYAERRPGLQKRLGEVETIVAEVSDQLRELAANLLPFALAPGLCRQLERQLIREADYQRLQVARELWDDRVDAVQQRLDEETFWRDTGLSRTARRTLIRRVVEVMRIEQPGVSGDELQILHHLAEPEQERLRCWIQEALELVPQQVQALEQQLSALQQEQREIQSGLDRAPEDEAIAPIHERIGVLRERLAGLHAQESSLREQIGVASYKRDEQHRRVEQMKAEIAAIEGVERQLGLARQCRSALLVYKDALLRDRLGALEEALVESFNAICRKEHLLRRATIAPGDFAIRLYDTDQEDLNLASLSAGERQLYALALLQALRLVSGRQLPLLIDTPLARLDEKHRRQVAQDYLPRVSDQVILFATDAEVNEGVLADIERLVTRVYRLDYDSEGRETHVSRHGQAMLSKLVTEAPRVETLVNVA